MNKNVLIIDDDPDVLDILQEALGYEGIGTTISLTADGYPEMIRQNNVGLVIIDFLLQGINGGEICHQIKNSPEFKHLPVIIYSAYPRVVESLGSYGCDKFISKPFDLYQMVSDVSTLTGMRNKHISII